MTVRNQNLPEQPKPLAAAPPTEDHASARKPFIEPEISSPVDVLAATTFFQIVDSGGTGFRPRRR